MLYGVYKHYDNYVPDTETYWYFETEEEAERAARYLNILKDTSKIAHAEGYEWSAEWLVREEDPNPSTIKEFTESVNEMLA